MKTLLIVVALIVAGAGLSAAQEQGAAKKRMDKASPQLMREPGGKGEKTPSARIGISDEGSPGGPKPVKKPIKK